MTVLGTLRICPSGTLCGAEWTGKRLQPSKAYRHTTASAPPQKQRIEIMGSAVHM
jgi:hypothetical protein